MILLSNALSIPLASGSVQVAAGSPPYLALRRYGRKGDETPVGAAWMDWPAVEWSPMPGEPMRTAPPWRGQLGHEPDPGLYVAHLVAIGREVRRTLHETGTFWLNIGDSYEGSGKGGGPSTKAGGEHSQGLGAKRTGAGNALLIPHRVALAFQADGWILRSAVTWEANRLPESVSGWRWERCRVKTSTTINARSSEAPDKKSRADAANNPTTWKPCPGCPKCEKTNGLVLRRGSWRPTRSVEMVFLFAKGPGYWASGEGVREACKFSQEEYARKMSGFRSGAAKYQASAEALVKGGGKDRQFANPQNPAGRNLRDVWRAELTAEEEREHFEAIGQRVVAESAGELSDSWYIVTESSKLAHYAGWPSALVRRMIQSSTPDAGCCRDCGTPWSEVVERPDWSQRPKRKTNRLAGQSVNDQFAEMAGSAYQAWREKNPNQVLGWLPSCDCNPLPPAPLTVSEARKLTRPSLVLDPFGGTGTTAMVARSMGRSAVSIDPILRYCRMGRDKAGSAVFGGPRPRPRNAEPGPLDALLWG